MSNKLRLAGALLAGLVLGACSDDAGVTQTAADPNAVPSSATVSTAAFVSYSESLAPSETTEPLDISKAMPPTSETDEPMSI